MNIQPIKPTPNRRGWRRACHSAAAIGLAGLWCSMAGAQPSGMETDTYDGAIAALGDGLKENMLFRKVHDNVTDARAGVTHYTPTWDLSDLPSYEPKQPITGTVRVSGYYLSLGKVADLWKEEFAKYQPNIKVITSVKGDLAKGEVDIQTGPRMNDRIGEISDFERQTKHPPLEIDWATGAYDVPGWSPAFTIFVHKDNPIAQLTVDQLDGIFGGSRTGGWAGTTWSTDVARGSDKDIRTWGQLGLTGEWANQPIHVLGRPLKYNIQLGFERKVFRGGDVWNENVREYAHEMNPDGTRYTSSIEMVKDLSKDKYAICFADLGSLTDNVKMVAVGATANSPYTPLSLENLHNRSYPLFLEQWAYVNQQPGKSLDPAVKEFLTFMLSRQGQLAVQQDAKWLPIPGTVAREQLQKLDGVGASANPDAMGLQVPLITPSQGAGESVDEQGKTDPAESYYTKRWDLSDLPAYQPGETVSGTIRLPLEGQIWESSVGQKWMEGFAKYHPGVKFEKVRGSLISKQLDLQIGRKWTTYFGGEVLSYQLRHKRSPVEVQVATGSYDVAGWSPAIAIYVNKDNPLAKATVAELDGIFGGPRRGGWAGTAWRRQVARGEEKNIRTWGQLGLTGEWANHPINVYTYPRKYHIMSVFERKVLQGGNMWNDTLREYPSAINPDESKFMASVEMVKLLAKDKYGIIFSEKGLETKDVKALAIAPYNGGAYTDLTLETVRNQSYPLSLGVYAYADQEQGKPFDPKVKEFLRYVLSREGQQAIQQDGKWLPLTRDSVQEQLKKLN